MSPAPPMIMIRMAVMAFLKNVESTQSVHTYRNYRADLLGGNGFLIRLAPHIKPTSSVGDLKEEMAVQYFQDLLLKGTAPATFRRRVATVREFLRFLQAHQWADVSADRLTNLLKAGKLKPNLKPPERFDELEPKILRVLVYALKLRPAGEKLERLIMARNRAFVIVLADTGLRVHEACKLTRSDIHWKTGKALIIGKGSKEGTIRFSLRSLRAVRAYLEARADLDGASGTFFATLPLFARHDDGGSKKVKPISTKTGEDIIHQMARAALGEDYDPRLTCHKFRHYFVTMILRQTNNLMIGKEMARHADVKTTQGYAHVNEEELDRKHREIFSSE